MTAAPRPKLIYLVTEDWYFWSHRLPMARAALAAGFDVAVATRVTAHGERIRAAGFTLHPLRWRRRSFAPWALVAAIMEISSLYRRERPRLVHHVALKPAVLGGIAAQAARVPAVVSAVAGFGFLASSTRLQARLLRPLMVLALKRLLARRNAWIIVQNDDDRQALLALDAQAAERIVTIRGSGVDVAHFSAVPEPPAPPITAGFAGRMLVGKGVAVLVEAQQRLQRRGFDLRLALAGMPDAENPDAIAAATLASWEKLPGITWLRQQSDVREVWRKAHIAVQPSLGGEGLPMSLLEAAAMARAIVATDVPGCREIARADVNALLVPPGDADALAAALERVASDTALRHRFAAASRRLVESDLAQESVGAAAVTLYRNVIAATEVP
jgi:glycosyltransferase involved in cell wall biosynthesis